MSASGVTLHPDEQDESRRASILRAPRSSRLGSNVHIKYGGGPVFLRNVRFLTCTFEMVTDTPNTDLVAEYIVSNAAGSLKITAE